MEPVNTQPPEDMFGDKYQFRARAWKGDWTTCPPDEFPAKMEVDKAYSWALGDWDDDERGGRGLYICTIFKTPKGKLYTVYTIIPKDELIKALALLVRF